jgi:hypothetical protein
LEIVIATSAEAAATTVATTLEMLFGRYESLGVLFETVAVAVMVVPAIAPGLTFNVIGMLTDAPEVSVEPLQLTLPVPPEIGVMQVHPAGGVIDWNVVFGGVVKLYDGTCAVYMPRFEIVCV